MNKAEARTAPGPRPTPRPAHRVPAQNRPDLLLVDSPRFRQEQRRKKLAHAGVGVVAATATLVGGFIALGAAEQWAHNERASTESAAPKEEGDVCVVIDEDAALHRVIGDRFGDGTSTILRISNDFGVVSRAHPGEGVGICRPADSEKLNDNYVVASENISPDQLVDMDQFEQAGGVSQDVTLGK